MRSLHSLDYSLQTSDQSFLSCYLSFEDLLALRPQGYEEALKFMKIDSLRERRVKMDLRFAKKSVRQDSFSSLFPNVHLMTKRNPEKYVVKIANAQRMKTSAVPFQRLLNEDICKQRKDLSNLLQVNNGVLLNAPIT